MEVVADFPAGVEATEVFDPGVGAFDGAAVAALGVAALASLAGAVAAADLGCDAALGEPCDVGFVVIATVGPHLARWVGQLVDQRQQVCVVVFSGAGDVATKWRATRFGD